MPQVKKKFYKYSIINMLVRVGVEPEQAVLAADKIIAELRNALKNNVDILQIHGVGEFRVKK